jgi:glyoxylase-like metal-dependent hydrolase (beta-lactamase superfamily II)
MKQRWSEFGIALLFAVICASAAAQDSDDGSPRLVQLTESVYRVVHRPMAANTSVVVTDEGLIVIDATCRGQGNTEWLKPELDRRFGLPVKYVILSHDHSDHICGLQVFDDTATTVSHTNTRKHIVREGRNTSIPDVVFNDELEIHLGGKTLYLYYFGHTHSNNLIQIHIPEERILIAPDLAWGGTGKALVFPDFRDSHVENLIETLGVLSKLDDVDIVVPGHRGPTTQQAFSYFRDYVVALQDRVLDELIQGATIEEILERVTMDDFSDYENYDWWLHSNVISMWDNMYRWREPDFNDAPGNYQDAYPIGFPIGDYEPPE